MSEGLSGRLRLYPGRPSPERVLREAQVAEPTGTDQPTDDEAPEAIDNETSAEVEDFDPERALRTIRHQREVEKEMKARIAELEAKASKLDEIEEAEREAQRSLEDKLAAREQRIAELESKIQEDAVKAAFIQEAVSRGYEDPELAFLAAKAQGVLGQYDPKTGKVGEADLGALEERHPLLAAEAAGTRFGAGDAGTRSRKPGSSVSDQFNATVRDALSGRL